MEKKDKITQAIKNIKIALKETKYGSKKNLVSFNKDEFLSGSQLAREYKLDKDEVQSVLLNLYKNKTSINVNSTKRLVTFISHDLRTIYLHPLAKDIFVQNLSRQKD